MIFFSSCYNIGSGLWNTVLFYVLFYVHSTDLLCDHSTVLCDLIFILFQKFWVPVINWWENHSGECLLIDDLSVMYGYKPEDPKTHILNYYILLGKRHIFLQRIELKSPSFDHFLEFVKDKSIVQ